MYALLDSCDYSREARANKKDDRGAWDKKDDHDADSQDDSGRGDQVNNW